MGEFAVRFLPDSAITDEQDRELRELLFLCFQKECFREHRYYIEMPTYHWCIYDATGKLVAHTALHLRRIVSLSREFVAGGIAEVCVHPDFQRRGLVKTMMQEADDFLAEQNIPFALLFGEAKIYTSSGYTPVPNKIRYRNSDDEWIEEINSDFKFKKLGDWDWPEGQIDLCGPFF